MSKSWKSLIFKTAFRATLLILFAASLLYILFLANGLQYDFFSNQIRKTGIIDITYADPHAKVYLDGQKLEGVLPFVASNVLPGEYNLVIAREGYWDYAIKVKVFEDLISRVNTVFLYPIDVLGHSIFIMDFPYEKRQQLFLRNGYIFQHEKNELSWAKLQTDLVAADFLKTTILAIPIKTIKIVGREALVEFNDGQKQIVDLFSSDVQTVTIPDHYVYGGNQWFYYKDNLIASFDRKLGRVLWAKYLEEDLIVESLETFAVNSRNFLSITVSGGVDQGRLYEVKGEQLQLLIGEQIKQLELDKQGILYYQKNDTEIWKWQLKAKIPQLLVRFQRPVRLLSLAANFYRTSGILIIQNGSQFFIMDEKFNNVREMFPELEVDQIEVTSDDRVYFLNNFNTENQQKTRLLMLDLAS